MKRSHLLFPILLLSVAPACPTPAPAPFPDAAIPSGLKLQATPDSLLIRPATTKFIRYLLVDGQNQPVPFRAVEFSLSTEEGTTAPAWLSFSEAMTNANGEVVLQVTAKPFPTGIESLPATLSAQTEGAALTMDLLVSVNNFSVRILPRADELLLGLNGLASTRVTFFDGASCRDLNLAKLPPSTRPTRNVLPGSDALFAGLSQLRNHAVAGIGYDATGAMRIGGCLDLPGSILQANETVRATLFLDRIFPVLPGTYQVLSQFLFATPLPATTTIQSAWQQLAYCPYDPARLWIDCTLDALSNDTDGDPLDCVPVVGRAGGLGALMAGRRGVPTAPLSGTSGKITCYDRVDARGRTSLEILVDSLFANARSQLLASNLAALPGEIETMLSAIQLHSAFVLSASGQANRYHLEHSLQNVTFPRAALASIIPLVDLLAPITRVTGLTATHRREQLSIPRHDFTLRLGSVAAVAFQNSSLRKRGIPTIEQLVDTLFDYAELSSNGGLVRGCDALDTRVCETLSLSRGCVYGACEKGRTALAQKLRNSFLALNGPSYDFMFLSGAASVLDVNNDGQADALGTLDFPGIWSTELITTPGTQKVQGSWTATPRGIRDR